MVKQTLSITGMTCASCAKSIERSVGKVDGVHSTSVNYATEKLVVEFDESKADIKKTKEAVVKAGYGAQEEQNGNIRDVTIPISGMTCASCAKSY